jgi:hypothetical protein
MAMGDPTESFHYDPFAAPPEPEPDVSNQLGPAKDLHWGYNDEDPISKEELLKEYSQDDPKFIVERSPLETLMSAEPERMWMGNYEFLCSEGHRLEVMYNPNEFEQGVESEWARFSSAGSGYAHMHFHTTKNPTIEMELYYVANTIKERARAEWDRLLLYSWMYPRFSTDGFSIGPPRLLVVWPGTFEMICYLVECRFKHLKFAMNGSTTRWTATIKLERAAEELKKLDGVKKALFGLDGRPVMTADEKLRNQGPLFRIGDSGKAVLNSVVDKQGRRKR